MKCPHCNYKLDNKLIASAFARIRTEKLTLKERKEIGQRLTESRRKQ